jgi:hypothetical protein
MIDPDRELPYKYKLQDPRWKALRRLCLERDNFICRHCGVQSPEGVPIDLGLVVHHLQYAGDPWESPLKDLLTLCKNCHDITHFCVTPNGSDCKEDRQREIQVLNRLKDVLACRWRARIRKIVSLAPLVSVWWAPGQKPSAANHQKYFIGLPFPVVSMRTLRGN